MQLTEEQLEHFYREGYVVVPGLVPPDVVRAVLAASPTVDESDWTARIFDQANPNADAGIHRLLTEPGVVEAVTDIFTLPPRVFYGMLAVVPAHGGNGLPWHQDNQYSQVLPQALNTFIALSDITPDKAILWVAPRSHLSGVIASKDSELYGGGHREAAISPENGVPLPTMKAGDACIFDRSTLHRSLKNETGEPRYAYAAQYTPPDARGAETGKRITSMPLVADLRRHWQEAGLYGA